MRRTILSVALIFSISVSGFALQSDEDGKFEEFKGMMERYYREYSPQRRLLGIAQKSSCFVRYTVKMKQASYGGVGRRDFGSTKIIETKSVTIGTIVSPDGIVIIGADLFQDASDYSGGTSQSYISFRGRRVSKPYGFRIRLPIGKVEYNARLIGVSDEVGLAFLKAKLPEGTELPFLDIKRVAMDGNEIARVKKNDFFCYMKFKRYISRAYDFDHFTFLYKDEQLMEFREIAGKKYGVFVGSILEGTPVFDLYSLKLLGFSATVTERMIRQTVTEGITDQTGQILTSQAGMGQGSGKNVILASYVADVIDDIEMLAKNDSGWTGITEFQPLDADTSRLMGLIDGDEEEVYGIIAVEVVEGSPAYVAGLRSGDIITSWYGKRVVATDKNAAFGFSDLMKNLRPGERVPFIYRHYDGEALGGPVESEIIVGKAPKTMLKAETYFNEAFGVMFTEITQDRISRSAYLNKRHLGKVLIKDAESGGWFEVGGVYPNDVVLKINGRDINSIADVKEEMERISVEQPDEINMLVERSAETMFVNITPDWSKMGTK